MMFLTIQRKPQRQSDDWRSQIATSSLRSQAVTLKPGRAQTAESAKLDKLIWANLQEIGYGG